MAGDIERRGRPRRQQLGIVHHVGRDLVVAERDRPPAPPVDERRRPGGLEVAPVGGAGLEEKRVVGNDREHEAVAEKAVAADPEVPAKVLAALSAANRRSSNYRDEAEEKLAQDEITLLGTDPHQYELGPEQRKNIAVYTDFFYRMGAIERYVEPEEIFI